MSLQMDFSIKGIKRMKERKIIYMQNVYTIVYNLCQ